jgi:hypothetical protein
VVSTVKPLAISASFCWLMFCMFGPALFVFVFENVLGFA